MPVKDTLSKFPVADHHKSWDNGEGYAVTALAILYGVSDQMIRNKKIDLTKLDLQRLQKIKSIAEVLCNQVNVSFKGLVPLDHGKGAVALLCDEEEKYVVRIQQGELPDRPKSEFVLPALNKYYDPKINLTFEVLEKLETTGMTKDDAFDLKAKTRQEGILDFWDVTSHNIGRDIRTGKILILDPDSYSIKKPSH